jgi:hypothetical protein
MGDWKESGMWIIVFKWVPLWLFMRWRKGIESILHLLRNRNESKSRFNKNSSRKIMTRNPSSKQETE